MTSQINPLVADGALVPPEPKGDLVTQARVQATSPLQKEFAKLLEVIDATGAQVQALERLLGAYRAKFGQILPPLQAEQERLSRQMVLFLHARLQQLESEKAKSLTSSHRKAIGRMIVSLAKDFAMQGDAQMHAIHDQYSHESIDEMDAANVDGMLDLLDEMGVELPMQQGKMSTAELARAALKAMQEKMAQQQEIEVQRKARRDEKRAEKAKLKAKADPKAQAKLAEKEQAAQEAQHSLRNIYRQLARQLHPDRADNDAQRALNHDLMSEANVAYQRQDLLALLKLQLTAQQIDASAMNTVALLRAQFRDLASECADLQNQMQQEFRISHPSDLTPAHLEKSLAIAVQDYDHVLHVMRTDLEAVKTDAGLKRWAKANSRDLERHSLMDESFAEGIHIDDFIPQMPRQKAKKKR
jgi:hypothetical protein